MKPHSLSREEKCLGTEKLRSYKAAKPRENFT